MKVVNLSQLDYESQLASFQDRFLNEAIAGGHEVQTAHEDADIVLLNEAGAIANLREKFGRQAFLIGVVGIPAERLGDVITFLKRNHLNLCLAQSDKEIFIVTAEGCKIPLKDTKVQLSDSTNLGFWEFIKKRMDVSWYKTQSNPTLPNIDDFKGAPQIIHDLLGFTHRARLLTDHNGNLSVRLGGDFVAMSPRSVDKSMIGVNDMMVVHVDQTNRIVSVNNYGTNRKPSIDSGVSDVLYRTYPSLSALVHTHSPWVVGAAKTTFPYPCGVVEEASEIQATLSRISYQDGNPFLVHMLNHGQLLGLAGDLNLQKLQTQWAATQADFSEHMAEVAIDPEALSGTVNPILSPAGIVGYVYIDEDGAVAPRLLQQTRGRGWGRDLLRALHSTHSTVKTVAECKVEDFYVTNGFTKVRTDGRIMTLKPNI